MRVARAVVRLQGEVRVPLQLVEVREHLVGRGWPAESRFEGRDVRQRGGERRGAVEGRREQLVQRAARECSGVREGPG